MKEYKKCKLRGVWANFGGVFCNSEAQNVMACLTFLITHALVDLGTRWTSSCDHQIWPKGHLALGIWRSMICYAC